MDNAVNLANMAVPTELDAKTADSVSLAIKLAFVDTFRIIALIAAGLAWLSAVLAAWLVEPGQIKPKE
jgi:hypothetical protein